MAKKQNRPITDRLIDIAAGVETGKSLDAERRVKRRYDYDAYVALVLLSPNGERLPPELLRARDISASGISVIGRKMFYPGSVGVMQMVRSNGRMALVGVQVMHCRYAGRMEHCTGLTFTPMPRGISSKDFLDRLGRLVLLNPALEQNIAC